MFTSRAVAAALACLMAACAHQAPAPRSFGFGTPATADQIRGWDIDARPDGAGLPPGSGSVAQGLKIYEAQCLACHGVNGEKGIGPRLAGGKGSLGTAAPVKSIGSFWPYASTLYDYINRSMPHNSPQSMAANDVYAVTAYLLNINGIVGADAVLDARSLPRVVMPNQSGFVGDPRPDVAN